MPPSNRKPGEKLKEHANEPFKRSVAGALRAIARRPDLEVVYASERPLLTADRARLAEPPRKLDAQAAAIVRGQADAMALRLACHNASLHRTLAPQSEQARLVFDAVEQTRCEAIGARRMEGVAQNLPPVWKTVFSAAANMTMCDLAKMPRLKMRSPCWCGRD